MFGQGIYFADIFDKSIGYSGSNDFYKTKFILLAEVALGEMEELYQAKEISKATKKYNSVLGVGRRNPNPDQKIVLNNGCVVPVGEIIERGYTPESGYWGLQNNEYIVFDKS